MLKGTTLRAPVLLAILLAIATGGFVSAGDSLGPWQARLRSESFGPLNDVTFGDPFFVAVGLRGTIIYSIDGASWAPAQSGTTNDLFSVFYSETGLWVAAGTHQTIAISSDGIHWSVVHSAETNIVTGLAYGNGKYVALASNYGSYPQILISTDGFNWTANPTTNRFHTIAFGNGVFVAMDYQSYSSWNTPPPSVKVSTNAVDWTVVQNGDGKQRESRVQFVNNRFFISLVGGYTPDIEGITFTYPIILSSQDGTNWVSAAFPDVHTPPEHKDWGDIAGIAFGHGVYTAVGSYVYSSTNGQTWLESGSAPASAIAFGTGALLPEGKFVTVAKDVINFSQNGKDWTPIFAQRPSFVDIAASPNAVVAIAPSAIAVSTNGVDFQLQRVPYLFRSISYGTVSGVADEGAFLVVGEHVIGISKNGIDWTFQDRAESYFGSHVGGNKFVASHSESFSASGLEVSRDATTWTEIPSPIQHVDNYLIPPHGLTFGNGRFVLLSLPAGSFPYPGPAILQAALSDDAMTWTNRFPIATNDAPRQIVFGKSRFVAATSYRDVWTSYDAQRWISLPNVKANILAYGKGIFAAFDNASGDLNVSSDGVTWIVSENPWTTFATPYDQFHAAACGFNTFYLVGDGGLILQSSAITSDRPLSVSVNPTGFTLFANTEPGSYTLQRSGDLVHWQEVASFNTGNESDLPVYQTSSDTSQQFFRLVK